MNILYKKCFPILNISHLVVYIKQRLRLYIPLSVWTLLDRLKYLQTFYTIIFLFLIF